MDYVYQNSFVTIAAEAAEDGSKGIFGSAYLREPLSVLPYSQFRSTTGSLRGTIYFRADWEDYDGANRGVLSNRAWCLQEEILSPRILRFGKSQILWKCATAEWREWKPIDERGNRHDFSRSLYAEISRLPELNRDWIIAPSENTKWSLFQYWYISIVNFYVGRQITFPRDKFMALAGIANVIQDYLSSIDYKAGMWVEDIHSALARGTPKSNVTDYKEYVAPSWSRAHLDCSSERPQQHFLYDIHLVQSFTPLATILRIFNRDTVTRETPPTTERLALEIRGEYCDVCSCKVVESFLDIRSTSSDTDYIYELDRIATPVNRFIQKDEFSADGLLTQSCLEAPGKDHQQYVYVQLGRWEPDIFHPNSNGNEHKKPIVVALILKTDESEKEARLYERVEKAFILNDPEFPVSWLIQSFVVI